MRGILKLLSLIGVALSSKLSLVSNRDHDAYDYYALHLDPQTSPESLAAYLGIEYDGQLSIIDDHHIFRAEKHPTRNVVRESVQELKARRKLKRDASPHLLDGVLLDQKQLLRKRLFKRSAVPPPLAARQTPTELAVQRRKELAENLGIADPIFNLQWHLFNADQPGNDMNVTGVWTQGITGKNVTVCIIDDGLDMDSEDLKGNYCAECSYDFNDKQPIPKPKLFDDQHGTRCAGEVAAIKNNVCGVGVAYEAHVSGVRILSAPIADVDEAEAVLYKLQDNHIFSCSWGPPDDGKTMDAPGILIKRAMQKAIQQGRNGLGTIYVFAAGNGAAVEDNCNFDGYTNSIFSVTIGAIDKTNSHPYYSEKCSAQLAVTYSSGAGDAIHTTDVGQNKCTAIHGGTSAAGPLVTGIYALVLSIRPDLSWRDIQWLTVLTSVPIYKEEPENQWQTTALGRKFSHQFGYGRIDGYGIVEMAKTWNTVKKQAWYFSPWIHVRHPIPEGKVGLASTFEVTADMMKAANLARIEHVTVTMNADHKRRGDLSVELHSPAGIISHLAETRKFDDSPLGYRDWTFMTVAHFGETQAGNWTVIIKDSIVNQMAGTLTDWRLKLYGESIDESIQGLLPLPEEHEDDNHDKDEVTTGLTSTTAVPERPSPSITVTTGLPTRPTLVKPTNTDASSAVPSSSPSDGGPAGLLPSGKRRARAWVYGAFGLTVAFCAGLAYYLWRKRRRARTDNYEFSLVAGDLYDAFAGEDDSDVDAREALGLVDDDEDDESYDGGRREGDDEGGSEDMGDDGRGRGDEMSLIPKNQFRS
jgi:kexin